MKLPLAAIFTRCGGTGFGSSNHCIWRRWLLGNQTLLPAALLTAPSLAMLKATPPQQCRIVLQQQIVKCARLTAIVVAEMLIGWLLLLNSGTGMFCMHMLVGSKCC